MKNRLLLSITILVFAFCVNTVLYAQYTPKYNASELEALHRKYLQQDAIRIENLSKTGLGKDYYNFHLYFEGMLSAFEATNDELLLIDLIRYSDNIMETAVNFGNGQIDWDWLPDLELKSNQLSTFRICVSLARTSRLILNNTTFKTKYKKDADRIYNFVYDLIINYHYKTDFNEKLPWNIPIDFGGSGQPFGRKAWHYQPDFLAQTAAHLYKAKGDNLCLKIAQDIGNSFKRLLVPTNDGWVWDDGIFFGDCRNMVLIHDVSHANSNVMMMDVLHEAGIVFSESDMIRMTTTLTETIWQGNLNSPHFYNYINGNTSEYILSAATCDNPCGSSYCVGTVYSGWVTLGKYSEKAQQILTFLLEDIDIGNDNAFNDGTFGRIALSGHLLKNAAIIFNAANISTDENIIIYPNPSQNTITISTDLLIDTVSIYDMNGKRIFSRKYSKGNDTIEISSLSIGLYILQIETKNKGIFNQKFTKY
jgi:hypothetical protein